ncbi:MAG: adenylate/guanylate cyclase domain-containing protein [Rhodanobacteraceae bacterium]
MAKLIAISNDERQEFELSAFNSIGRHPDNTIQIRDRIISKEHAQIRRSGDGVFVLRDLSSLNGTFIRGERIVDRVLTDGDEICMGSTRLQFVVQPEDEVLQKVTTAPGLTESLIRQTIAPDTREFLPESAISDQKLLRRDYERLRIGLELARAVGSVLNLDTLLPKIVDKTFDLVGADRGAILLMNTSGELVARYVRTRAGKDDNIVLSNTVIDEVMRSKAAVLSSDAMADSRFSRADSIIVQGIRSTMTVPLLHGDEMLGIMHLDSRIAANAFTEKDLQICTSVAAQAAIAIENARLAERIEKEAETRVQIARLIPPAVVEQVMKGALVIERGGRLSEITMLFADIRGFTSMCDGKAPDEVVWTLNDYFEAMVDVLFKNNGTLDKFVGDSIIGLFGAPIALESPVDKAIQCALDMQEALREFNRTRMSEGLEELQIGIGINTGEVITGNIGSTRAMQYTAIGDAMNVASRLCGLAQPGEILISESTYAAVADRFEVQPLSPVKVKGKAAELRVFRVLGAAHAN